MANKPTRFCEDDARQMITDWKQLAEQHQQLGNHGETERLTRLATQMQAILDNGLYMPPYKTISTIPEIKIPHIRKRAKHDTTTVSE